MKEQKGMHATITCKVSSVHDQVPARGAGIATTLLPLVCCVRFKGCSSQTPAILEGSYGSNCHQHFELWHLTPQWVTGQTLIPAVSNRSCALDLHGSFQQLQASVPCLKAQLPCNVLAVLLADTWMVGCLSFSTVHTTWSLQD